MRQTLDWTPYRRSTVGFDRLFDFLENAGQTADSYPPYDVEKLTDDRYRITLAVAGFKRDEIDITSHQNLLTVAGRKAANDDTPKRTMLYTGIATRAFERRFQLADYVQVTGASHENGLLHIDLVREIPEAKKPRLIQIGGGAPKVIEAKKAA